ncbi:MAG: hypothetical protein ABIQ16_05745, partial [Polyangiaceae bacterium]
MSSQLPYRPSCQSWLLAAVVCVAFSAACGGASDAIDEAGAGSASTAAAAGRTAAAGSGSVASGGQFAGFGGSGSSAGSGGNLQFGGALNQSGGGGGVFATGGASTSGGGAQAGAGGGAQAGAGGSGGMAGHAGQSSGGSGGTAGHGGQSSGGSGGMAASTPTWTEIYTKFLSNGQYGSNCNGAACHNPGKQKGYDFSTQANGYASVKSKTSQFVSVLSSGSMPQGKTKMPAADLATIKA